VIYMEKGVPVLRSALAGKLLLELTYRDPFAKPQTDELQRGEQAPHIIDELSTAAGCDTSESLQLTTRTWFPELSPELAFRKGA
jgi:hypothetical protein